MSITLDIPDEIANAAKVEALSSGSSLETLLLKTLAAHFSPAAFDLQTELDAWDEAADHDMARFLENGALNDARRGVDNSFTLFVGAC